MIQFRRTDSNGSPDEILTLCRILDNNDGETTLHCEGLGRAVPYLVRVSEGDDSDAVVCDLDGDRSSNLDDLAHEPCNDAPTDVIAQIAEGWATGTCSVARIDDTGA